MKEPKRGEGRKVWTGRKGREGKWEKRIKSRVTRRTIPSGANVVTGVEIGRIVRDSSKEQGRG